MGKLYLVSACFFCFLTIIYSVESVNPDCIKKVKASALLETVENFLTKAEISFPKCKEYVNPADESECGSLAYIHISKNMIANVRKNFPTCFKPIDKDDKIVDDGLPKDCSGILSSGRNKSGIYTVWSGESSETRKPLKVYCDMETDGGGWTVVQRRGKFPVQQDFYRDWESYKNGFGNLSEEFWLGNENIRILCLKECKIRFDMVDEKGDQGVAVYQNFSLSSGNYMINISGYSGNVGDAMQHHNKNVFSTKDKGIVARANTHKSGWWFFSSDYYCNPNGIYQPGKVGPESVLWWTWRNKANLDSIEIKIKPT